MILIVATREELRRQVKPGVGGGADGLVGSTPRAKDQIHPRKGPDI
ncbi:MAG: hypothetical protein LBG11_09025 [Bifidobacteriaceae bacterium]|jgi:hypothetical protein|nr:hypothetical protein [Bifidobacteriaceae bacterium]